MLTSGQSIVLNGALTANTLQLWAGTSIEFARRPTQLGSLFAYAPHLTSVDNITVLNGGQMLIGAGGIDMGGFSISGLDNVATDGDMIVGDVSVKNLFRVGGMLQSSSVMPHTYSAFAIELPKGIDFSGDAGAPGGTVTLNADWLLFDTAGINGVNLDGGDASLLGLTGGDGGTLNIGTTAVPNRGDVVINTSISATTGANTLGLLTGGQGGSVLITANGTVAVNSSIKVSDSAQPRASNSGGKIEITSKKTSGNAINVSSSAQLLSLLSNAAPGAGGTIKFTSAGGTINMSGTARADRGTVEITNTGAAGVINVQNATLNAGTVKVGALGANGTLNVGGGSISADSLIHLYAGGSNGSVIFNDDVTLSGNSVKTISGNTVTIRDGKIVTVTGPAPASVFTNNPNYTGSGGNGTTTGVFGGNGATTAPLASGPGF